MKPCRLYREAIVLVASGEKGTDAVERVKTHIAECECCRRYHEEMRALCGTCTQVAEEAGGEQAPEGLYRSVARRIRSEDAEARPHWMFCVTRRAMGFSAAAVLVIIALFLVLRVPKLPSVTQDSFQAWVGPAAAQQSAHPRVLLMLAATGGTDGLDRALAYEAGRSFSETPTYRVGHSYWPADGVGAGD